MTNLTGFIILVVDDEPETLDFFCTVFEDYGAKAFAASDGDEALKMARGLQPDLITLDLSMPGTDGVQVFKRLRNDPNLGGVPVCIITGRPEMRSLIYQRGVRPPEGYLDKPVDEQRLLSNVARILALSHRRVASKK